MGGGIFHIAAVFLVFQFGSAQSLLHSSYRSVKVERIGAEHGLSHSTVTDIIQDRRGFIWIATMDGLNRFDGYTCKVYRHDPNDSTTLSTNFLHGILEDRDGTLWITTRDGGLNRFDPLTERVTRYLPIPGDPTSINDRLVGPMLLDRKGRLWVGGNTALNLFHRETGTFTRFQHDRRNPESISHNEITTLLEDREGQIWVGTLVGLNLLDPERGTFRRFHHDARNPATPSHDFIRSLCEDSRGILWFVAGGKLNTIDAASGRVNRNPLGTEWSSRYEAIAFAALFEDSRGNLWLGTGGDGLFLLDRQRSVTTHFRYDPAGAHSISHNNIRVEFEDSLGTLWLSTWGGGVNKIAPSKRKFRHVLNNPSDPHSLSSNFVFSLLEDRRGTLWVGTAGGGLNRYDAATGRFVAYRPEPGNSNSISNAAVWAIVEDSDGTLWIGTDDGLNRFDPIREQFTHVFHHPSDPFSLAGNTVKSLFIDRAGRLWAGTNSDGLCRLDRSTGKWTRYQHDPNDPHSIGAEQIWAITEDSNGNIWVGTFRNGLNKLDVRTGRFIRYEHNPHDPTSIGFNDVRAIHRTADGLLWVATYGGGLNVFDPATERFTRYTTDHGLPNNFLYGILEDEEGNLWISSNRGISKFDRGAGTFRNYTTDDGLQADEYNTGAFFKNGRGEMYFGGVNGFNHFHPATVGLNRRIPPVVITSFRVFEKEVRLDTSITAISTIRLEYSRNFFSFEFAALDFLEPAKNQYAYKLEGFDPDWIQSGSRRFASYTNLDPGEYVFRVKGSNNDGVWNEEGASVRVVIVPPFWMTGWFRIAAVAAAAGAIGGAVRYVSTRRLRQQLQELEKQRALQEERERISRDLHDHAGSQLTSIIAGIELAGKYSRTSVQKARRVLATLQEDARTSMAQLRETIWALKTDSMSVKQFADELESYAVRQLRYRRSVKLRFVRRCEEKATLTPMQVLNLFRVFQEAIANALHHTKPRTLSVEVLCANRWITLRVTNEGLPVRRKARTEQGGQGLMNLERRVSELRGYLRFVHNEAGGASVEATVPLSGV